MTPTPTFQSDCRDFRISKNSYRWTDPTPLRFTVCLYRVGRFGLQVFNSAGEKIKTLGNWNVQYPTSVTVDWDGRNERHEHVSSGVYVIYFREPDQARTAKVLVVR
jgi:hypothetical protein